MKTASPSDWKTKPLPEERVTIELSRRFTSEELSQIRRGVVPEEMEDKWFVYWKDDALFFHRSWTGFCTYVVRFDCDESGATITDADVNRKSDEYTNTDDSRDADLILYLIDTLLLRRPTPFPATSSSDARSALEQWSEVGQAGLGIHPGDDREHGGRYVLVKRTEKPMTTPDFESRIRGCLQGGAVGDALGAPVEFMGLSEIQRRFGQDGPADYEEWAGPRGGITDDTQMTLFTAEGLIRGMNLAKMEGVDPDWTEMFQSAYWRWLWTQGSRSRNDLATDELLSSWLTEVPELSQCRAPGNTCLSALRSGERGTPGAPINISKGCGGVMRVAPVGLVGLADPFRVGCLSAAATHGHRSGWLAAGCLALIIHQLMEGKDLIESTELALEEVRQGPRPGQVVRAVEGALDLTAESGRPSPESVESLGAGWIAEEALAIGLYCALVADDFEHGVRLAVTHSGDSDSTGSITGQILGCQWGSDAIPERWLADLELRDVIAQVAEDLYRVGHDPGALEEGGIYDPGRYPAQ